MNDISDIIAEFESTPRGRFILVRSRLWLLRQGIGRTKRGTKMLKRFKLGKARTASWRHGRRWGDRFYERRHT